MNKKIKIKIDKEFEKMGILGYDIPPLGYIDYAYNGGNATNSITYDSMDKSAYVMEQLNYLKSKIQILEEAVQANDSQKISSLESRIIELEKVTNDKAWEALYR